MPKAAGNDWGLLSFLHSAYKLLRVVNGIDLLKQLQKHLEKEYDIKLMYSSKTIELFHLYQMVESIPN